MAFEELTTALSQIISVARIDSTCNSLPETETSAPTQLLIGENDMFHSDCTIAYDIFVGSFYVLYYCNHHLLISLRKVTKIEKVKGTGPR